MKTIFKLLVLLLSVQLLYASSTKEQERDRNIMMNLNWIKGPTKVSVGSNATFNIPKGFVFLNPKDTETLMELFHNPKSSQNRYYFSPEDMHWFGLFSYENTGYIKDDEKIDDYKALESFKRGTEEGNKIRIRNGWEPLKILGWKYRPFYDSQTQRLTWAIDAISGNEPVINYNTRILGRYGVTSVTLVASPNGLEQEVREFKNTINGYSFNNEDRYASFKEGDKVAEYGLMALIAGGAAAVATKKGLWAVIAGAFAAFWKLIIAGFIALLAGVGKFFGKKDN
jgi:uncharacterized membrane-anchored protein